MALSESARSPRLGTASQAAEPTTADIYARLHDPESAGLELKTSAEDPNDPSGAAMIHNVRGRMAAEAGDLGTAVAGMETYGITYSNPAVSPTMPATIGGSHRLKRRQDIRIRPMPF